MSTDRKSLQHFCERYGFLVMRLVKRWSETPADAEDIAQDVWKEVARVWPFPHLSNAEAYLTEIAKNKGKEFWRRKHTKKRSGQSVPILPDEDSVSPVDGHLGNPEDVEARVDSKRMRDRLFALSEMLSDPSGDAMRRLVTAPETVTREARRRCLESVKRVIKNANVDRLHEGPSHIGHVLNKLKKSNG